MKLFKFSKKTNIVNGEIVNYFDNGEIEVKYFVAGSKKFGLYQSYHPNGKLKYKGHFHKDVKEGKHEEWDIHGNLINQEIFEITEKETIKKRESKFQQKTEKNINPKKRSKQKLKYYSSINKDRISLVINTFSFLFSNNIINEFQQISIQLEKACNNDDFVLAEKIFTNAKESLIECEEKISFYLVNSSFKNVIKLNIFPIAIALFCWVMLPVLEKNVKSPLFEKIIIYGTAGVTIFVIFSLYYSLKRYFKAKEMGNNNRYS